MHKCINNSIGNVYHLEQFVSEFFPYSQKQLGFDQPVEIRFESDPDNAGVMLGKTAYYDPSAMEIALYVDGRHPKDIMRSLSHELVHHAQNCRGDFTGAQDTGAGYAQEDPHLRKMEREAYTKGNLIFRDFEDLIKTGKINIEIDFSDSGEPKMSLKEWKNKELNMLLMKKWGILSEGPAATTSQPASATKNPPQGGTSSLGGMTTGEADAAKTKAKGDLKTRKTKSTKSKAKDAFDELDEQEKLGKTMATMSDKAAIQGAQPQFGRHAGSADLDDLASRKKLQRAGDADPGKHSGATATFAARNTGGDYARASQDQQDDPLGKVKKENRKVTVQEARNMARRIIKRILEEGQ